MKTFWIQGIALFIVLLVCLEWRDMLSIDRFLAIVMLLICSFFYKRKHDYYEEKKALYEELVREYRLAKRHAYRSEKGARLEERTRIAREIHDAVGHKLTSLLMLLRIKSLSKNDEYEDVVQLAEEALHETRKAVTTLQSKDSAGLSSVIQLIRKLESESHISVSFTTEKGILSITLSNQQNVCLYRMLQEALTNAMKHAHSREVEVTLRKNAVSNIEFIVVNKVQAKKSFSEGFGLRSMKERIQELGGEVTAYYDSDYFVVKGSFPEERSS